MDIFQHYLGNHKKHIWPIVFIFSFLLVSYLIISSPYMHLRGDAGAFARHAKILYEKNTFDVTGSATATIGQLFFSNILCKFFGFDLKILHISVYIVNFLFLIGMYALFYELGVDRFWALMGSFVLLINPVTLQLIDWYLTEPFFLFYLSFCLLFFIKGLRSQRISYLYLGSIFCVFAILTRQHAISISFTLILLCIFYRKNMQKNTIIHCLVTAALPVISIGLFYLLSMQRLSNSTPYAYAAANVAIIKSFLNPIKLLSRLYFDGLFFLHYSPLYLAPLFFILIPLLFHPRSVKNLPPHLNSSTIALFYVSIGTLILYFKNNQKMPYIPNIFSVGSLTRIFRFKILTAQTASVILTIFTWIGATIILTKLLEYFFQNLTHFPRSKSKKEGKKNQKTHSADKQKEDTIDLGKKFFYGWGITYLLVAILVGLRYDRYIFPFSLLVSYVIVSNFSLLRTKKKLIVAFVLLFYVVFIYKIIGKRFITDLFWEANYTLLNEGIPHQRINGGLGFNHFYNFDYINELYKKVKLKRPINWYKFHPIADFFITSKKNLQTKHPGLVLYKPLSREKFGGIFKARLYIYKRKKGYSQPIWL